MSYALDIFDDALGDVSVEEVNARASREDHGWEPLVAYEDDANALKRVVVSFDSEDERREFDRRFGALEVEAEENLNQDALFEVEADAPAEADTRVEQDGDGWVDLPLFVRGPERLTRTVEFRDVEERSRFLERAGIRTIHKGTRGTLSVWWPERPKEDLASLRFADTGQVRVTHPVYVISKGRATSALTPRFLARDGVPFRLVVEPQEADAYRRSFGDVVSELPFSNLGQGSTPARNWCWEDARQRGHSRHWILDDNIGQVRRLWAGRRIPCASGPALAAVEDFVERYENVAVSGLNYQMFVTPTSPPYRTNVHVYSCLLIDNEVSPRWRLRYNEDTDLCLQVLAEGFATVLVSAFMIDKKTTMTMTGGNTDALYDGDGRTRMARSLRALWPEVVTVRRRFGRDQHVVDWGAFRQELVPRAEWRRPGERGFELVKVREPDSPALRRLFDEYWTLRGEPQPRVEFVDPFPEIPF